MNPLVPESAAAAPETLPDPRDQIEDLVFEHTTFDYTHPSARRILYDKDIEAFVDALAALVCANPS